MAISLECPRCTAPISTTNPIASNRIKCPKCQKWIRLRKRIEPEETAPGKGAAVSVAVLLVAAIAVVAMLAVLLVAGGGLLWWTLHKTASSSQAQRTNSPSVDGGPAGPKSVDQRPDTIPEPKPDLMPEPKTNPKPGAETRKPPAGWQLYADMDARFSVFFPEGKIEERSNKHPQTGALSSVYVLQDHKASMDYTVVVVDGGAQAAPRGALLEAFKAEAAKGQTLVAERHLKLGEHLGVEQQFVGPDKSTVARAFEVSGKIYAVAVALAGPERPESKPNIETCLASFLIAAAGKALVSPDPDYPANPGVGKPPPGWQAYVAPDRSYSVWLPDGEIKTVKAKDPTLGCSIIKTGLSGPTERLACWVDVIQPDKPFAIPGATLDWYRKELNSKQGVQWEQRIMVGNQLGVEVQAASRDRKHTIRAFEVSGRIIAVTARSPMPMPPENDPKIRTCLESFKIPAVGPNMPGKPLGVGP